MKYIKTFEYNKIPEDGPQIGDFVIISIPRYNYSYKINLKIQNKIGKIIDYVNMDYKIHFKNVGSSIYCNRADIIAYSKY